jgi:hypothetical protein
MWLILSDEIDRVLQHLFRPPTLLQKSQGVAAARGRATFFG